MTKCATRDCGVPGHGTVLDLDFFFFFFFTVAQSGQMTLVT